jgi:transcriptional regulator with XRE-family HTH domain
MEDRNGETEMNRIREAREAADMDLQHVARELEIDVAEAALAEMGVGNVRADLAMAFANLLDAHPGDLFPGTRETFDEAAEHPGDLSVVLSRPDRAAKLTAAGVDPDPIPWYAVFELRCGVERRYLMNSLDMAALKQDLLEPGDFAVFLADCRHVAVRKSSVAQVRFGRFARYARFASRESAWEVQVVTSDSARPERFEVEWDGEGDASPFAAFLEAARKGGDAMPRFLSIEEEDGEVRYLSTATLDVIEIAAGVLRPSIYGEGAPARGAAPVGLEAMEALGSA